MLLSIITINYNNKQGLEKTIDSVSNQTSRNFEYIIIDGASTDGSWDVIKRNLQKINYWVSEKDNGIYDAINKGIIEASGKYLMFLNSGDSLSDNGVIDICIKQVAAFPETDIFYGDIIGFVNKTTNHWLHRHPSVLTLRFFKDQNLNHQSSLIKSTLFKEFGLYPTNYKLAADHWLYLKSFVSEKTFRHIDYPLVVYDFSGISSNNRKIYNQEMHIMWVSLIPDYVKNIVVENDILKLKVDKMNKKVFKVAAWVDKKVEKFKTYNRKKF